MHRRKISKKVVTKIVVSLLVSLSLLSIVTIKHNKNKINELEYQLSLKQAVEEQSIGTTQTVIDVKTIEGKFNELVDYTILKDYKVSLKHTYNFDKEAFLGLHKKGSLVAYGTAVYDVDVRLSDAELYYNDKNQLIIRLNKPFLDKESVHLDRGTMKVIEDESDMNILCNEEDGQGIMKFWLNSFVESAIEQLEEYYKDDYQSKKIESIAKQEVKRLIDTLGFENKNYKIEFK